MDFNKLFPDIRYEGETNLRKAQLVMLRMLKIVDFICDKYGLRYWLDGGTLLGAIRHKGFIPWDDDLDIAMPRDDYERFLSIASKELPEDLFIQTTNTDPAFDMFGKPPCKIRDEHSLIQEYHKKHASPHQGIFLDIFPIDRMHDTLPESKIDLRMKRYYWKLCILYNVPWVNSSNLKINLRNMAVLIRKVMGIDFWLQRYMKKARKRITQNKQLKENYKLGFGFDVPWVRFFKPDDIFPLQRIPFEDAFFTAPFNYDSVLRQYYGDYRTLPPEAKRVNTHTSQIVIDSRVQSIQA